MRTITISAKCSDMFWAGLNVDGQRKGEYDGYVPDWFPHPNASQEHYGDYVQLEIDIDTGKIVNWKKPTKTDLAIFKS